jgi:Cellulase (glycosyl hydrolase family 5)
MQLYMLKKIDRSILLLCIVLLSGCRSFTDSRSKHYNPDEHYPLNFGMCQISSVSPKSNVNIHSWPGSYEVNIMKKSLVDEDKQELLDEMGIQWWRNDFSWKRLEPQQGYWYFQKFDWLVNTARENNSKVLALLVYDTPWIYEEEGRSRNITEKELEHYLNYARTIAERYGDSIGGFEIWNEPNFGPFWTGSEEDFFTLTRETVKVLKEVAPDVPVAVGALSYHPVTGGKSFLKKMIEAGALEGADAVSLHPYGASLESSARRVADVRTLLKEYGYDHRIWITEMGFPTTGLYPHKVALKDHYAQTIKTMTLMTAAGADLITWYKLFDTYEPQEATLIVHSERSFGLMSRKSDWKPGAHAYALLANELSGMTYNPEKLIIRGLQKSAVRAFLYEKDERVAIVLWSRNPDIQYEINLSGIEDIKIISFDPVLEQTVPVNGILGEYPLLITGICRDEIIIQ